MESATGRVSSVDGDRITVRVDAPVACRRCAAGKGCGAGLLDGSSATRFLDVDVPVGMQLDIGDEVTLTLSPRRLLRAAALAYGLPLLSLVTAATIAWLAGAEPDSLVAVAMVIAGLAAGIFGSRYILNQGAACDQFEPTIVS